MPNFHKQIQRKNQERMVVSVYTYEWDEENISLTVYPTYGEASEVDLTVSEAKKLIKALKKAVK